MWVYPVCSWDLRTRWLIRFHCISLYPNSKSTTVSMPIWSPSGLPGLLLLWFEWEISIDRWDWMLEINWWNSLRKTTELLEGEAPLEEVGNRGGPWGFTAQPHFLFTLCVLAVNGSVGDVATGTESEVRGYADDFEDRGRRQKPTDAWSLQKQEWLRDMFFLRAASPAVLNLWVETPLWSQATVS